MVKKRIPICVTVYTQYRRVTDGRTDRQTECQTFFHIVRAMHTRRAVKIVSHGMVAPRECTPVWRACVLLTHLLRFLSPGGS